MKNENSLEGILDFLNSNGMNLSDIVYINSSNDEKQANNCVCESCSDPAEELVSEKSDKVYLFTSSAESNISVQIAEAKAKANANLLGLRKTKVEIINLTGKEIVNDINPYDYNSIVQGSYKMSYIDFVKDEGSKYDYISAGCGILELKETNDPESRIGLVLMAYSYYDDMDELNKYITDGLMEIYASGFNSKYTICDFHTAMEGFNPIEDNAIVIAGIID